MKATREVPRFQQCVIESEKLVHLENGRAILEFAHRVSIGDIA